MSSMSKSKAFGLAFLWLGATVVAIYCAYALPSSTCGCIGLFFLLLAGVYGWVGFAKLDRDKRIAASAEAMRAVQPLESGHASSGYGGYGARAPQTTPGSSEIDFRLDFTKSHPPERL